MVGARPRAVDAVIHVSALSLLVACMAAMNDDVRRFVVNMIAGDRVSELMIVAAPLDRVVRGVADSFNALPISHGPMVMFGALAAVLTWMMFKM